VFAANDESPLIGTTLVPSFCRGSLHDMVMKRSQRVGATAAATAALLGGAGVALAATTSAAGTTASTSSGTAARQALVTLDAETAKLQAESEALKKEIAAVRVALQQGAAAGAVTAPATPDAHSGGQHGEEAEHSRGAPEPRPAPVVQPAPTTHTTTGASGSTGSSHDGDDDKKPGEKSDDQAGDDD